MQGDAADIMVPLGRVLLGGLFVAGGVRHFSSATSSCL
jgi:hypothetical protein